jgi:ABC-type multidrug transport system fused ATPase/permease subunit
MWSLLKSHKRGFFWVAFLQLLTTSAALIPPRAFGELLEELKINPNSVDVRQTVYIVIAALVLQSTFVYFTRVRASILGEFVLSALRERFVTRVVELPPNVVERAGAGELLTRTTTDIDHITWAVRSGNYDLFGLNIWHLHCHSSHRPTLSSRRFHRNSTGFCCYTLVFASFTPGLSNRVILVCNCEFGSG